MPAKPINLTKQIRKIPRSTMFSIPLDVQFPTSWLMDTPSTPYQKDPVEFVHPHNVQHREDVGLYGVTWWGSLYFRLMNKLEEIYHSNHEPVIVSGSPLETNHPRVLQSFQIYKGDFPFIVCATKPTAEVIDFAYEAIGKDSHTQLSLLSSTILGLRDLPYSPSDVVWQHFLNGVKNSDVLASNQICRLVEAEGSLRVILPWLYTNEKLPVSCKAAWLAISTSLCAYKASLTPIPKEESWIYKAEGGWFDTQIKDFIGSFSSVLFEDYNGNPIFDEIVDTAQAVENIAANTLRVSHGRVDLKEFGEEPIDGVPPFIPSEEEKQATQLDNGLDFTQIGTGVFDVFFQFWHPMSGDVPKQGSFKPWYKVKKESLPYGKDGKMTTYEVAVEDNYLDLVGTEDVSYQLEKENRDISELIPALLQLADGDIVCGLSIHSPSFEQQYGPIKVHIRPCMIQKIGKVVADESRKTHLRAVNNDCYHITVLDSSGYSSSANLQNWMLPNIVLANQEVQKQIMEEADRATNPPGNEEEETMKDDWKWVLIIIGVGLLLLFALSNNDK